MNTIPTEHRRTVAEVLTLDEMAMCWALLGGIPGKRVPMSLLCAALDWCRLNMAADTSGVVEAMQALVATDMDFAEGMARATLANSRDVQPKPGALARFRAYRGIETDTEAAARKVDEQARRLADLRRRAQEATGDDADRARRRAYLWDPREREGLCTALEGVVRGDRATKVRCPSCGRRSVWFFLDPETTQKRVTSARCAHANSCGWGGSILLLAGLQ